MMLKYLSIFLIISLNSCNSNKNLTSTFIEKSVKVGGKLKVDNCPSNGKCIVSIHENSELEIRKELGSKEYPVIIKGVNTVYEYKYYNNNLENYQDGNDFEVVLFELSNSSDNILKNEELKKINAFYGKFCYCKDIAGYYRIDNGNFNLTKSDITFDFINKIVGERQIIKNFILKI